MKKYAQRASALYSLKLGDMKFVGPYEVRRVPGGWLWEHWQEGFSGGGLIAFVPFNDEFDPEGHEVEHG